MWWHNCDTRLVCVGTAVAPDWCVVAQLRYRTGLCGHSSGIGLVCWHNFGTGLICIGSNVAPDWCVLAQLWHQIGLCWHNCGTRLVCVGTTLAPDWSLLALLWHQTDLYVISGFPRGVNKIITLLGCYAPLRGSLQVSRNDILP